MAKIERARVAFNLLTTVAESMEDTWQPEITAKLSAYMDETEAKVRLKRAFKDAVVMLKQVASRRSGSKSR